ncbi:Mn2+-dependent serine/threonine protein kinase [Marinobacter nauticus VT8]|uniref:3-deoxy-D-manno-octulosonic acid kinase n=1 Tax=Marinobacter nauticus (strain ATCC 700491 / DSM 11845 / VT8) TaxID=351348 RepID=A1TYQ6_MARN8|nr:Mn2+-dependent serine/threonine protein kinase [Marinobacter nauticus VT8]
MGSDTEVHIKRDGINALVVPGWAGQFDPDWFDPGYWGERAVPVSSGGRGSAWFVERSPEHWVLRHYRRGGLAGKLIHDRYLYAGEAHVRSFAEFRLLIQLRVLGLPVPEPVAVMYQRRRLFYSSAIIIERLHGVRPLGDVALALDKHRWREIGQVIRQFHDAGVYHADLNCFNILVGETSIHLIDFDKGELRAPLSPYRTSWKGNTVGRLKRSLNKAYGDELERQWQFFLEGYNVSTNV